jgi:hypothetical protein
MGIVTCDIDGVISDCTERYRKLYTGKHLPGWEPDWDAFHGPAMDCEPVHDEYVTLIQMLHEGGHQIYLLTNRLEQFRRRTVQFMNINAVPYHRLLMRREDEDFATSKGNRLDQLIACGLRPSLGIDDDPAERTAYENRYIPFLYVHRGHHTGEITRGTVSEQEGEEGQGQVQGQRDPGAEGDPLPEAERRGSADRQAAEAAGSTAG